MFLNLKDFEANLHVCSHHHHAVHASVIAVLTCMTPRKVPIKCSSDAECRPNSSSPPWIIDARESFNLQPVTSCTNGFGMTPLADFRTLSYHSVCVEVCSAANWRVSQATVRTDEYHRRFSQIDLRRRVATLEFVFAELCAIPSKHPDSHDSRELFPLAARSSDKYLMTASTIALIASSGSCIEIVCNPTLSIAFLSLSPFTSITQAVPQPVLVSRIVRILTCTPY